MHGREIFAYIAHKLFQFGLYVTLLQRWPCLWWITTILRLSYLIYLITFIFITFFYWRANKNNAPLGYLIGIFSLNIGILTNVVIFVEMLCKENRYQRLMQLEYEVDALLEKQIDISSIESNLWRRSLYQLLIHTTYDVSHLAIAVCCYKSPVFYLLIPLITVVRLRYIQITILIERQNERVHCFIRALTVLVSANHPKDKFTSDIWQPYAAWEYKRLNWLRLVQGRLYKLYQEVGACFGWSIIALLFVAFFNIVCNLFWSIEIHKYDFQLGKFAYNVLNILRLGTFVAMLLATADRARRMNMLISALIFKLPKPLGNKVYNDQVSSIALQCIHQGFGVSVKGSFNLNLTLLGDMIALIVTYLVILLQFLLSEEVFRKRLFTYALLINGKKDEE